MNTTFSRVTVPTASMQRSKMTEVDWKRDAMEAKVEQNSQIKLKSMI